MISLDGIDIGERMRKKRVDQCLTQAYVSKESGITEAYYRLIEKGKRSPSIEALEKIAKTLKVSSVFLLNARFCDVESRVERERKRLDEIFEDIPKNKLEIAEGLITQAARLRILLDDNWSDIVEHGEYEKFKQSESQMAYDRKRPIVESYDNRDKTYQLIVKQLTELLPQGKKQDKKSKLLKRA
ncbi:MAG: helix-turn-helix domain-containing protein [Lactococcus lactis]|nr:helix-turn-helix domain-containing protein [Lactococcus lactis]MDN5446297.1 helix-turn-helix domain-containing protein [Lactococcus lactis]